MIVYVIIEFKKMLDELDNIEIKIQNGITKLNIVDRNKPITRALYYLQYLSLVQNVK